MRCFHPVEIDVSPSDGGDTYRQTVRCGKCHGCSMTRARDWAVRCHHERQMHRDNCMVTLTYADEHLPLYGSLVKEEFPRFVRRLRKSLEYRVGEVTVRPKVRYFHCGEYGEQFGRPHYHGLLFGYDFPDKYPWKQRRNYMTYRSPTLESLWTFGHSEIGTVTQESAEYIARYILLKIDHSDEFYERVAMDTGEVVEIEREYITMSRRPGIGAGWLDRFHGDVFPRDEVIIAGKEYRPPRYYGSRYEAMYPEEMEMVKARRRTERDRSDDGPDRLRVLELCAKKRGAHFNRELT